MKIIGISGSPRAGGNTDTLLGMLLEGAVSAGGETEAVYLRDYAIHPCTGCERCRKDLTCTRFMDGMHLLYPKIEAADGLILGSPTYNYNITPEMKAFIDRLYPYYRFSAERPGPYSSFFEGRGRQALVFSVAEQTKPEERGFAIEAMQRPLAALGFAVTDTLPAEGYFEKRAVAGDAAVQEQAREAGRRFVRGLL
ncbi:flavodoxin family protein [Methanogenium organophilum]|uniref:Flavodoxin family protein n=1 Tax=Methanogenium organophilum TaxID=2199 RepID=A0A9X9S2B0_METOG|nr:flavodoxin family protein [Methanogenium organophilum]WAI00509.1 flavodoxin family protein [Methanogenium organophilum]